MKQNVVICLLLIAATSVVYGQTLRFEFVSWDDPLKVTDNAQVKAGLTWSGVSWAFTTTQHAPYWHPITWLSHMVDCDLYGTDPAGHHATNVLIHLVNALLLFALLRSASNRAWPSGLAAALFALHPLHVESVAWVSGRPGLLSTMFALASLWAYARYTRRRRVSLYLLTAVLMALSLMSKPDLVTLP